MSSNLRNLIQTVRSAKTATEERAIVQRESAAIRHVLGGTNASVQQRSRCVLKLAYISMLGYSTEFAQMNVVTLMAEPDFVAKRVSYLAIAILLDERQEVLTLCENHLKRDLTSGNPLFQCLALDAVANLAGEDMVHDVLQDVMVLLDNQSAAVRRKACLVSLRIVRKVPSIAEGLIDKLLNCVAERNHAVLITCLTTLIEIIRVVPDSAEKMREKIPGLVTLLKGLVLSAYATEYDVGSVADPFLQCTILRFFAFLAKDSHAASEAVNDILAQVATNTDGQRNVGCAVLYECVRTISTIQSEDSLRVLGVNILGRFVLNKDNNIRYVALSTLKSWISRESSAVQRHRMTIMECLKDSDISLRRKALELTVALVNSENVRAMVPDLLSYLGVCSPELKADCASMLCSVVEEFAPTPEWRVETSLRLLLVGESYVPVQFALNFIGLITRLSNDLKSRAVCGLWNDVLQLFVPSNNNNNNNSGSNPSSASSSPSKSGGTGTESKNTSPLHREAALLAGVWTIGEYSSILSKSEGVAVQTVFTAFSNLFTELSLTSGSNPSTASLLAGNNSATSHNADASSSASNSSLSTSTGSNHISAGSVSSALLLQQYVLTAITKMATHNSSLRQTVRPLLEIASHSLDCELQQRACEYLFLLEGSGELAQHAFEAMPQIPEPQKISISSSNTNISLAGVSGGDSLFGTSSSSNIKSSGQQQAGSTSLETLFGGGDSNTKSNTNNNAAAGNMADIFGGGGNTSTTSTAANIPGAKTQNQSGGNSVDDIFGGSGSGGVTNTAVQNQSSMNATIKINAFENSDLAVTLNLTKRNPGSFEICDVEACVRSKGGNVPIRDAVILVSVLKTMSVQMQPAISTNVEPNQTSLLQKFVVDATQDPNRGAVFQARVKISYSVMGSAKNEVFTVNKDLRS